MLDNLVKSARRSHKVAVKWADDARQRAESASPEDENVVRLAACAEKHVASAAQSLADAEAGLEKGDEEQVQSAVTNAGWEAAAACSDAVSIKLILAPYLSQPVLTWDDTHAKVS